MTQMKRHWKKSKLGVKIISYMLAAALVMGLAVSVLSIWTINLLEDSDNTLHSELENLSSEKISEALINQAQTAYLELAIQQAENKDQIFKQMSDNLQILTDLLEKNSSLGADYGAVTPEFSDTENGVAMGRATIVGTESPTDRQINQLKKISLIENTAASLYENEPLLRNVLVGTETGVFYRYSDYNDFESSYDPRTRDWYTRAMNNPDTVVWSNAYTETYGHLVVKCSKTFRDENGEIAGVAALDISIQSITDSILESDTELEDSFLLDSDGSFIAKCGSIPENFVNSPENGGEASCYEAVTRMKNGEFGISAVQMNDKQYYAAFAPLNETGWSYCLLLSDDVLTEPVQQIETEISALSEEEREKMTDNMIKIRIQFVITTVVCALLVSLLAVFLSEKILHPIRHLAKGIQSMGKGNLQVKLDVQGDDEIAQLGNTFNKMADDLQQHVDELKKITAEKQRISTELHLAKEIQADMLPSIFPPFPDRAEFDLYASMDPAKEVGGDFYDFFLIDNDHLALLIADVSGKGIPGALFMMISKTILKTQTLTGGTPAAILQEANNRLCENNKAEMFVTCWLGIYEISTGKLIAANAGHEYPALRRANGAYELLKDKHGFVLAGMEGAKYKEYELTLEPGDSLFVYTDGIPEATDAQNQLFGTDRMLNALNLHPDANMEETLLTVTKEVEQFVGSAEQFDDMTMLGFRRNS